MVNYQIKRIYNRKILKSSKKEYQNPKTVSEISQETNPKHKKKKILIVFTNFKTDLYCNFVLKSSRVVVKLLQQYQITQCLELNLFSPRILTHLFSKKQY